MLFIHKRSYIFVFADIKFHDKFAKMARVLLCCIGSNFFLIYKTLKFDSVIQHAANQFSGIRAENQISASCMKGCGLRSRDQS